MFVNTCIQVSHTFNIIGLIAESTLKVIKDIRSKIFETPIFEMKVFTKSSIIFKHYVQFTTIKSRF